MRFHLFHNVLVRDLSCQCWLASCCVSGQSEFALPVVGLDSTEVCPGMSLVSVLVQIDILLYSTHVE